MNIFTVVGFVVLLPVTLPLFVGKVLLDRLHISVSRCRRCGGSVSYCACGTLVCDDYKCFGSSCSQCM